MIKGFELVASGRYSRQAGMWDILDVAYGASHNWDLHVLIDRSNESETLVFEDPVSFRVQYEGRNGEYWAARAAESVDIGLLYRLRESDYLTKVSAGMGAGSEIHHYLVAGNDACVEVIVRSAPTIPATVT